MRKNVGLFGTLKTSKNSCFLFTSLKNFLNKTIKQLISWCSAVLLRVDFSALVQQATALLFWPLCGCVEGTTHCV